jgi:hypothetical protein
MYDKCHITFAHPFSLFATVLVPYTQFLGVKFPFCQDPTVYFKLAPHIALPNMHNCIYFFQTVNRVKKIPGKSHIFFFSRALHQSGHKKTNVSHAIIQIRNKK